MYLTFQVILITAFILASGASARENRPLFRSPKTGGVEDGDVFIIQAGTDFKVLAGNKLDEMCMATPAAVRGSLIIRTISKLYRIRRPL